MMEFLQNEWAQLIGISLASGGIGAIGYRIKSKFLIDFAALVLREVGQEALTRLGEKASAKEQRAVNKVSKKVKVPADGNETAPS